MTLQTIQPVDQILIRDGKEGTRRLYAHYSANQNKVSARFDDLLGGRWHCMLGGNVLEGKSSFCGPSLQAIVDNKNENPADKIYRFKGKHVELPATGIEAWLVNNFQFAAVRNEKGLTVGFEYHQRSLYDVKQLFRLETSSVQDGIQQILDLNVPEKDIQALRIGIDIYDLGRKQWKLGDVKPNAKSYEFLEQYFNDSIVLGRTIQDKYEQSN